MADDTELNEGEVSDAMSEYDEHDAHVKDEDDKMTDHQNTSPDTGQEGTGEAKKKLDPKDPLRPRRKKARRACYACQRAHLTCGDERPCQRCIKRGLAEQCQDGVRKKAKYLHDAPPEALGPVLGPSYNAHSHASRPNPHRQPSSVASEASSNATATAFFSQPGAASTYGVFSPTQQTQVTSLPDAISFSSQQSPVSPTFQESSAAQMGSLTVPQVSGDITSFSPALFDPSNPALYNFNLEGLNFGSQYGAMEFSMLGHMSSGAAETPPRDPSISQPGAGDITFGPAIFSSGNNNGVGFDKIYDANVMGDFLGLEQSSGGPYSQGNLQHGLPHAYAIAAGPGSLQSPSTENNSPQPTTVGFDGSPTTAGYTNTGGNSTQPPRSKPKASSAAVATWFGPQTAMGKRYRDSSRIYENVTEPYMYVRGFHKLIALLQKRLSASKILRVAKSLASIRPSFIACTRTLSRADLIFMEKSFQRSLFEFGEFLEQTSSPTVLCRRTGEVVAVNKEFTALTGWRKEVLLGKEPNLNVNTGNPNNPDSAAGGNSSGRTGLSTPRLRTLNAVQSAAAVGTDSPKTSAAAQGQPADSGPQPLFIAELMDDDSVIQFYEDFAQLAFENSRGRVTRKTRLFKYRTQAASTDGTTKPEQQQQQQSQTSPSKEPRQSILSNRVARIDGEHGISKIAKDGKLECSYCWHIRRDTFDIPMMIVMNFLPCYYPNQEPHQLAV